MISLSIDMCRYAFVKTLRNLINIHSMSILSREPQQYFVIFPISSYCVLQCFPVNTIMYQTMSESLKWQIFKMKVVTKKPKKGKFPGTPSLLSCIFAKYFLKNWTLSGEYRAVSDRTLQNSLRWDFQFFLFRSPQSFRLLNSIQNHYQKHFDFSSFD